MNRNSEPIFKIFLIALTALPAMSLGAVHPTILGLFAIAAALFLLYLVVTRQDALPRLDLVSGLLLALTAVTALQLLPLPTGLVRLIAPAVYEVQVRALSPVDGAAAGFIPLTLDLPLTVAELAKLGLYTAVYLGANLWTRRFGPSFVLRLTAMTGLAAAAVFIAHRVLLLDKIYGIYVPLHVTVRPGTVSAPLINANHMAGLLAMTTTVAIGCALAVRERSERFLLVSIAALGGGALMLTLSRGGIAAFIAGQLLFVVLRLVSRQRRRHPGEPSHLRWLPIGLALSLGLGLFVAQDAIVGEFVHGDIKKLDMAFEGIPLIARFWPTGVGRGAFGVTFQMVSSLAANMTATHAENIIVQLLADFGVPIGGAVLILAAIIIGALLRSVPRRVDTAAALAALAAFGIHNLVDFNSEIPGVAVLAAALAGVLIGGRTPRRTERAPRRLPKAVLAAATGSALVSGILAVAYVSGHHRDTEERRLLAEWRDIDSPRFAPSALETVLARHPADWFIPYIAGVRAYHLGAENPLPWLARAIELNPDSALTHLYIGGALLRAGHLSQALLELRLAVRSRPDLVHTAARLMVENAPSFAQIADVAITRSDRLLLYPAIAGRFAVLGMDDEAAAADRAVLRVDGMNPQSLARHARRLTAQGKSDQALILAQRLAKHPERGKAGVLLEAEILRRQGRYQEAAKRLEVGLVRYGDRPTLLSELALAKQRGGDFQGAVEAVQRLKATADTAERRAAAVILEADILLADGRNRGALAKLREAYALTPHNTRIIERIARLAEKTGDTMRALDALRALSLSEPDNPKIKARLEALEKKLKPEFSPHR